MVHLKIFTIITAVFMATVGYGQQAYSAGSFGSTKNVFESGIKQYTQSIGVTNAYVHGWGNSPQVFYYKFVDGLVAGNYNIVVTVPRSNFKQFDFTVNGERVWSDPQNKGEPYTIEGIEIEIYHDKSGFRKKLQFSINGKWDDSNVNPYSALAFTDADIEKFRRKPNPQALYSGQTIEEAIGEFRVRMIDNGRLTASSVPIEKIKRIIKETQEQKPPQEAKIVFDNNSSSGSTSSSGSNSSSSGSSNSTSNQGFQSSNEQNNSTNNNTQAQNINSNAPAPVYNAKDWEKFNQAQQSVNQWNQDWYKRIEQNEQIRLQKQALYEQAGEQIGTIIGNYLNELEQRKQREEIAKKQKAINSAVSNAFSSVKREASYWSSFLKDLLNVANKYSGNLNKTAYDEIESSLNSIKQTLDKIGEQHNYLQEKLRKDWDYADNDPRRFPVSYWKDYSYSKDSYIYLSQTFTIGSRISDKITRCNFVNDLLPLINKHAERSQSTHHITSIEQAYIASGCKNYSYENLLKNAKAIEAYEKMRNEKTRQIQALKKMVEEEMIEIKVLESTSVKVENISNQYQIEGINLQDLNREYNLLKDNAGVFEDKLNGLNPDNLIKAYGGANISSYMFKPSGIYVTPGTFEITLSKAYSSPKEHKVTLNAQKGQKTLTINPKDYDGAFDFDARFKPYKVTFASKYQKKNAFGKMYWLVPEFKFYTSGIAEFNLTPISFNKSYNPKGFYKGRPVFFHRLDFLALVVGKGSFINGFVTSDNSQHYRLHSDFWYFGGDLLRYEPGFTMSIFKSSAELRLYGGGAVSFINFRVNEKEDNAAYGSSVITEDKVASWNAKYAVYPGVKYVQRIGKTTLQIGYNYNAFVGFDKLSKKNKLNFDEFLYHKYTPFNEIGNFFRHEFSIRFTF